jgi:DNA-binding LacI/PurR family transcriptional regulator
MPAPAQADLGRRRAKNRDGRSVPVMNDVARLSGVSQQTVSRVANGATNVSEATRSRVLEAMHQLGYYPNLAARTLVTSRSHNIGVIGIESALYGPASILLSTERAADAAGYRISVAHLRSLSKAAIEEACRRFADQSTEGILLIEPVHAASKFFLSLGMPVVALGRSTHGIPSVTHHNVSDARQVVQHLLSLGHHTVFHIAGPENWTAANDRVKGWRTALEDAGRPVPQYSRGDWMPRSGYELGLALADNRDVTAIFVANDQMAVGVLHALAAAGRVVPDDVSVAGFDDIPEAEFLAPALTTIRLDFELAASTGLSMLIDIIEGRQPAALHRKIEGVLIARSSTAKCRTGSLDQLAADITRHHDRRAQHSPIRATAPRQRGFTPVKER